MSSDCIFCKIINKKIPADIILENNDYIVFKDINPKAKLHLLIVPKEHISSLAHAGNNYNKLLGNMLLSLNQLAIEHGFPNGFRTIINTGPAGGQEVDHLHIHLLAGDLPKFG